MIGKELLVAFREVLLRKLSEKIQENLGKINCYSVKIRLQLPSQFTILSP
jgi:hypothetical protein